MRCRPRQLEWRQLHHRRRPDLICLQAVEHLGLRLCDVRWLDITPVCEQCKATPPLPALYLNQQRHETSLPELQHWFAKSWHCNLVISWHP